MLRVIVYNVKGFRAGTSRVSEVVAEFDPDVALITECGSRFRVRRFAKNLGMKASHGSLFPFRRVPRNAVLVRPPWQVVSRRLHLFGESQRFYPRGAIVGQAQDGGKSLNLACTHFGLRPAERTRHSEQLVKILKSLTGPVILGGDLNDIPTGKGPAELSKLLWDTWIRVGESTGETFSSAEPKSRIDYLLVSDDVTPLRAVVPSGEKFERASDHLPLIVDLDI